MKKLILSAVLTAPCLYMATSTAYAQQSILGDVRILPYDYCPRNSAPLDGQIVSISSNQTLYSLIGTNYGGNGRSDFAYPDLRGRVIVGHDVASFKLGTKAGQEITQENSAHTHTVQATTSEGNAGEPGSNGLANVSVLPIYTQNITGSAKFHSGTVARSQGASYVNNMQPSLTVNYCLTTSGLYPSRN